MHEQDLKRETDFQGEVLKLAKATGWLRAHFHTVRTKYGWATPATADGKGFPDLVLVRDRVVFAELKRQQKGDRGLSDEQIVWRDKLEGAGAEVYVWGPDDWDEIERTLR